LLLGLFFKVDLDERRAPTFASSPADHPVRLVTQGAEPAAASAGTPSIAPASLPDLHAAPTSSVASSTATLTVRGRIVSASGTAVAGAEVAVATIAYATSRTLSSIESLTAA